MRLIPEHFNQSDSIARTSWKSISDIAKVRACQAVMEEFRDTVAMADPALNASGFWFQNG
jgi:hypothetical protein